MTKIYVLFLKIRNLHIWQKKYNAGSLHSFVNNAWKKAVLGKLRPWCKVGPTKMKLFPPPIYVFGWIHGRRNFIHKKRNFIAIIRWMHRDHSKKGKRTRSRARSYTIYIRIGVRINLDYAVVFVPRKELFPSFCLRLLLSDCVTFLVGVHQVV